MDAALLAARARDLRDRLQRRVVIGIAGPPGVGKSTIADALVAELGEDAARVPMDGFHLDDAVLAQLGAQDRKGAPDTFDADGFVEMLRRLRAGGQIYAPEFDRSLELSRAAAIAIGPAVTIVITEGNYLLRSEPPWAPVRELLDEAWWVTADDTARRARLVARHVRFGREQMDAEQWVLRSDDANAALVADDIARADLVIEND